MLHANMIPVVSLCGVIIEMCNFLYVGVSANLSQDVISEHLDKARSVIGKLNSLTILVMPQGIAFSHKGEDTSTPDTNSKDVDAGYC